MELGDYLYNSVALFLLIVFQSKIERKRIGIKDYGQIFHEIFLHFIQRTDLEALLGKDPVQPSWAVL